MMVTMAYFSNKRSTCLIAQVLHSYVQTTATAATHFMELTVLLFLKPAGRAVAGQSSSLLCLPLVGSCEGRAPGRECSENRSESSGEEGAWRELLEWGGVGRQVMYAVQ